MQHIIPALRITDVEASEEWYVLRLGFNIDWKNRDDEGLPIFMQISKFGLTLYLTEHEGDGVAGGLTFVYVADVDTWYNHCVGVGIVADCRPVNQPWGTRDFRITDPDGNRLCIATRLPPAPGRAS